MYRCQVCGHVSEPGQSLLKHITERKVPHEIYVRGEKVKTTRLEIAVETPVCRDCFELLKETPLKEVLIVKRAVDSYKKKNVVEGPRLSIPNVNSPVALGIPRVQRD